MKKALKIIILCVAVGAAGFGVGMAFVGKATEAEASPLPTASLQIQSHTYADGTVANSVVGDLTHADSQVQTWHVFIWSTPVGGAEGLSGAGETDRTDGETAGVRAAVSLNQFVSGTTVRGEFTSKDASGNVLYAQNITLVVP